jgi:GxxExxY protein
MEQNEVSGVILDACIHIHNTLGPKLLESLYERVLAYELRKRGLKVETQVPVAVVYDGRRFDDGFRMDMLVEDKIIIELKSIDKVQKVHMKQLMTYLRLADKRLGLMVNFGEERMMDGFKRLANNA